MTRLYNVFLNQIWISSLE